MLLYKKYCQRNWVCKWLLWQILWLKDQRYGNKLIFSKSCTRWCIYNNRRNMKTHIHPSIHHGEVGANSSFTTGLVVSIQRVHCEGRTEVALAAITSLNHGICWAGKVQPCGASVAQGLEGHIWRSLRIGTVQSRSCDSIVLRMQPTKNAAPEFRRSLYNFYWAAAPSAGTSGDSFCWCPND